MTRADGVLVIDKPSGPTSHDIVRAARRLYETREVGHAGTLDPPATGVLVLLFGEACKLSSYVTGQAKTYRAEISFGRSTDTLDQLGKTTEERPLPDGGLTAEALERALAAERSRELQEPPSVSAIRVAGVRAHEAARRRQPLDLPPRPVQVHELVWVGSTAHTIGLELRVSKGYYVRALARDLGAHLGVPAHLSSLRRLSSGGFTLESAVAWPLEEPKPLLSLADAARLALATTVLTAEGVHHARQGKRLRNEHFADRAPETLSAWLGPDEELVAIGCPFGTEQFRVVRGFVQRA